jgi:hypothetical protein
MMVEKEGRGASRRQAEGKEIKQNHIHPSQVSLQVQQD